MKWPEKCIEQQNNGLFLRLKKAIAPKHPMPSRHIKNNPLELV